MQENNLVKNWFSHRKISDSILSEFNVHWGSSPIMGECIVIPIHDENNNFLFNKYRRNPMIDVKPKYLYDKGGKITLYGWWKAKEEKTILITEGELDTLTAWSANIPSITSTGGANSFQEEWTIILKDKEIILCFDNDGAGGQGMARALKFIPHAYIVFLPDRTGVKDISDYISSGGNLSELLRTKIHFNNLQEVIEDKQKRISQWRSTYFHDAYIEENTIPEYVKVERKTIKNDADKITRAKQYPITDLIKFTHDKKALCIFHNEKTPSMQYYNDNHVYCFSCGGHGDAISVYRQINNCTFKEAVDKLQ